MSKQVPGICEMADVRDDTGSTVLHYSATGGFIGVRKVIDKN